MTTWVLEVRATVTNLASLQPQGGVDSVDMPYYFKLECYHCRMQSSELCFYLGNTVCMEKRNKKEYQMLYTCKDCHNKGSVKMIPGHGSAMTFPSGQDAVTSDFTPLMRFKIHEFEPVDYSFNGGWTGIKHGGQAVQANLLGDGRINLDASDGSQAIVWETGSRFRIVH